MVDASKGRDQRRSALEHGVGPKVGGATAREGEAHFCFGLHGGYLVGMLGILGCVYVVLLGRLQGGSVREMGGVGGVTDHHVSWLVVGS